MRAATIAGFFVAAGLIFGQAGDTFKPRKLPKDEQAALAQGLTLRFASGPDSDARHARLAALHVPEGEPPTPLLKPGPFTAKFAGYVKAPIRSEYQFHLVVKGKAELRINQKAVLVAENQTRETDEPVELARGYNKIEIDFTAPPKGDATLRVSWSGEGFNREPIPPENLFTRGDDVEVGRGAKLREGRMLFGTHGCGNCHSLPAKFAVAMPEFGHRAPILEGAARFQQGWLAEWIHDPRAVRPKATMPVVLHGETSRADGADIASYLVSLAPPTPLPALTPGEATAGEKLFRNVGCVACHHFNNPKDEETLERYPLFYVGTKYQPSALAAFLQAPHRHYPWSRMPDFKLSAQEAGHLTAYLVAEAKGTIDAKKPGDADRGAKLFKSAGCNSCHSTAAGEVLEDARRIPFPRSEAKGCLAEDAVARKAAPDFGFKKHKRETLLAFLSTDGSSLSRETPAEFAGRQIANLKCTACHRRDGATSRWFQVLEDEGTLPENLPLLTWTGEKLQPEWTKKLLEGGHDHRARPWLKARMPAFPARAELIALGLSHEHGFARDEDNRPKPNPELAEIGTKLLPQMGGLNCVQCHAVGKQPAVAPFEAPGINLLDAAHRLRFDYYQRWMLDPPRVDLTTKMVKLAADGKTTGIRDVFDGDAHKQFEALWHAIQELRK